MIKILKIIVSVAILVALGIGGVKAIKKAKAKDANTPVAKVYPIVVSQMSPKISKVKLSLPFLAEVANDKDVKLSSRIAARIQSIKKSGESVKKGEVIVRLDTTNIKSALASLKEQIQASYIALKNLKATHKRTLDLLKIKGVSIEESQKELTLIASSKAMITGLKQKEIELRNNLSYATIISPVDGVITKTFDNRGAISMPGKPLISISSKNGFFLLVRIPTEIPIKGVEFNDNTYNVTALGSTFHGLAEYKVYTGSDNLTTGDRVEVNIVIYKDKGNLLPFDAFLNRDGKSFVLVIEGSKATPKEVHIIQSAEQGVVIAESLVGQKIVIAKPDILLKLTSGYALKVKE